MTIRPAGPDDAATLGRLFDDAVRSRAPDAYTPAQVEAWAAAAADPAAYGRRLLRDRVVVAEDASGAVGFVSLARDGHIAALFVRGDRQRQGVGRALLAHIVGVAEREGMPRLYSEASVFALPLLLAAGFRRTGTERVVRRGVAFQRERVERPIG